MTDIQERIIKGCKFIQNIGSSDWNNQMTIKALKRLSDLIGVELLDRAGYTTVKLQPDGTTIEVDPITSEPIATPEFAKKLFNSSS